MTTTVISVKGKSPAEWLGQPRQEEKLRAVHTLRGKELGCWCGPWMHMQPTQLLCHAVVLAILADHWRFGMDIRNTVTQWMNLDA